jgi:elongation factor P--(R)-beta-lysine ligase
MNVWAGLASKRERLVLRAAILRAVRRYFLSEGFLEVATPLLSPSVLAEEHIDIVRSEAGYLLPSPEIFMKPLLAAGYENIFQIGPAFRKGERGDHHLPEFTLLEWYRTGTDYLALAADCERLLLRIGEEVFRRRWLVYQGVTVHLAPPWPKKDVREAFLDLAGWDPLGEEAPERFECDLVEKVVPGLEPGRPVFLMDFPEYEASLARKKADGSRRVERLELFAGGLELANGFSELTESGEQRLRFDQANRKREERGECTYPAPEEFLSCLDRLPASAGMALGVDRLVMLFTDASRIGEVVAF